MPNRRQVDKGQLLTDARIDEANQRYDCGECQAAFELLKDIIDTWPPSAPLAERQRAQLNLSSIYRDRGERQTSLDLLAELEKDADLKPEYRSRVFVERSKIHREQGNLEASRSCLQQAEDTIDFSVTPESGKDSVYLVCLYHNCHGRYLQAADDPHGAIDQFLLAREHAVSIEHKSLVTIYLNLANAHAVLGERERARDYLALGFSVLKNLDAPYAYGLVHYFETLASFNLFVYDSRERAIDCLSKISENVVNNFDNFKRVFDFFGELLVQSHEGKFDIERLKQARDYYDDPLIKAYLPTLIAGAPRPGEEGDRNRT